MKIWKLVVLVSLIWLGEGKGSRAKTYKRSKSACHKSHCYNIDRQLATLCISSCISPRCFHKIYAHNPLDYGEIDRDRELEFERCAKGVEY